MSTVMSTAEPFASPDLQLPVALLRLWPREDDPELLERTETLWNRHGLVRLGGALFGLLPDAARPAVFESAVQVAASILEHLHRGHDGETLPGLLVFPGRLELGGGSFELERDPLLDDLDHRPPRLEAGTLTVTGYAASWLRGRYRLEAAGTYDGPSGRRVPLFRLVGADPELRPWHNVEVLGRRIDVERPALEAELDAALSANVVWVRGPLGVGKSRAVWKLTHSRGGVEVWIVLGRSLPGISRLGRRLVEELRRLAPEAMPAGAEDELAEPERAEPERAAELLGTWIATARERLGETLWLVVDDLQTATPLDRALLGGLLSRPRAEGVRYLLIGRGGELGLPRPPGLVTVEVEPMTAAEFERYGDELFEGLSVPGAVRRRFAEASAGHPFPLEEGLVALVHRGLVRRVYGSFFFDGPEDTEYAPSQRVIRHVESELQSFGDILPLRLLAISERAVPASHLELAAASFGAELPDRWQERFLDAHWLAEEPSSWGPGLAFACPAYGRALADTLTEDAARKLRQVLGEVLSREVRDAADTWQTYRLLARSPQALPTLLQVAQAPAGVDREELYTALLEEYRGFWRHSLDRASELDLLWELLPLARRLGRLTELEDEMVRAVELARHDLSRFVALVTLHAEYEQERGNYPTAEKGLRKALEASEGAEAQRRALLFVRLGRLLIRQGRSEEAREIFENLAEVADREGPTALGATCHFYLGNAALRENQLEDAAMEHEQALLVRRRLRAWKSLGASLSALGSVALALGDFPKALERYLEAEEVLDAHGEEGEVSYALIGQGRALGSLGDHTGATRPLRRALDLRRGKDDIAGEAIARLEAAVNDLELGKLAEGLAEAREAAFRLQLTPASDQVAQAEQVLGRALLAQRQFDEAREHLLEALKIHREFDDSSAAAADHSWLIELGLRESDRYTISSHALALAELLAEIDYPTAGELLYFRLYRGLDWLREHGEPAAEPREALRRGFAELMRKTAFLDARLRNTFLHNVREHRELLEVASRHQLAMPE